MIPTTEKFFEKKGKLTREYLKSNMQGQAE